MVLLLLGILYRLCLIYVLTISKKLSIPLPFLLQKKTRIEKIVIFVPQRLITDGLVATL